MVTNPPEAGKYLVTFRLEIFVEDKKDSLSTPIVREVYWDGEGWWFPFNYSEVHIDKWETIKETEDG